MAGSRGKGWQVFIEQRAREELRDLPKQVREEALDLIEAMHEDPEGLGERMRGYTERYRVRIGDNRKNRYRMVYVVDRGDRQVKVLRIRHRSIAYKRNP